MPINPPSAPFATSLTLRQIQYFVTLAHSGSFTEAAGNLSVTQPALTAAIRQIEFLLGASLFVRSSRRLELTEAGEEILPLIERLLNFAQGTFNDVTSVISQRIQTVRIGMMPSISDRLLPILKELQTKHPSLRFHLSDMAIAEMMRMIRSGRVDLGIGPRDPKIDEVGLDCEELFEDEMRVVVRNDDPLSKGKSVAWARLAQRELALFNRSSWSDMIQRVSRSQKLHLLPAYRMEYIEPIYALVRQGMAVAVLPCLYTQNLREPSLKALPLHTPRVTRSIALITLEGLGRSAHVTLCREWIARRLRAP